MDPRKQAGPIRCENVLKLFRTLRWNVCFLVFKDLSKSGFSSELIGGQIKLRVRVSKRKTKTASVLITQQVKLLVFRFVSVTIQPCRRTLLYKPQQNLHPRPSAHPPRSISVQPPDEDPVAKVEEKLSITVFVENKRTV